MYARFSKVLFNIWSQSLDRKWPSFHQEYLLCQVLQQTWLACLLQPCDYPGPGNECGEMKLRGEQRADHPGPPPRSQPQFRYFRPFRIFLKIWTQRLICTPPLSTLHSSARLVMQPAMGGEGGVREPCGSSTQSWCSYNVNNSKTSTTSNRWKILRCLRSCSTKNECANCIVREMLHNGEINLEHLVIYWLFTLICFLP